VCYRLLLASPLTLSEVRSMLPEGAAADLAPPEQRDTLLARHPPAQTVVVLTRGGCACDLVGQRPEDDGVLRSKYRSLEARRADMIEALEQHRRPGSRLRYPVDWPSAIAGFVAEHARNAGEALYYLRFSARPGADFRWPNEQTTITASAVRAAPRSWLLEERPTFVVP